MVDIHQVDTNIASTKIISHNMIFLPANRKYLSLSPVVCQNSEITHVDTALSSRNRPWLITVSQLHVFSFPSQVYASSIWWPSRHFGVVLKGFIGGEEMAQKFGFVVSAVKYLIQFINQWVHGVTAGQQCTDTS